MANFNQNRESLIKTIIDAAFQVAIGLNQTTITTEHVLYVILQNNKISSFFNERGIDVTALTNEVYKYIKDSTPLLQNKMFNDSPGMMTGQMTASVQATFVVAQMKAKDTGTEIQLDTILNEIFINVDAYASYFMHKYGITDEMLTELKTL